MSAKFNHNPLSSSGSHRIGLLALHGFTGSPQSMRPLAEFFANRGYAVEMPRLPGHGTRWQDMLDVTRHDWLEKVDQAYWSLRRAGHQVIIAGLSMGGMLAIRESARREVTGTILINPFVTNPSPALKYAGLASRFVISTAGITSDIAKEGIEEGGYDRTPLIAAKELHLLGAETRPMLGALSAPVLYFRSAQDHVVSHGSHRFFQKKVTAPVEFIRLERSYHVATLDHDAPLIFEQSLAFVQKLEAAVKGQE